jgi:hypothetical protein
MDPDATGLAKAAQLLPGKPSMALKVWSDASLNICVIVQPIK